ncbi:hypothetical protein GCM10022378_11430 [Salinicoccus jeotgali]|uniref:BZIP domain-containing protein n=1 Tax=Salinicoccus jeotgali TaxID=381634 RepID=A0ABP7ER53_9STAP
MHYNHHCNGTCGERLDAQATTIRRENLLKNKWRKKYHELLIEKTHLAIKAGKQVAQLQREKRELTALVNKLGEENKRLKCSYTKAAARSDANWDGGKRRERVR